MKVVGEGDCLITDCLGCSHYLSEMVDRCRIQNSKVCVYCGKVQVSKT